MTMRAMATPFEWQMEPDRYIRGDYWAGLNPPRGIVILCHGYRAHKDALMYSYIAARFAEAGFDVVNLNFSHNGVGADLSHYSEPEKFAVNTYGKEIEDLCYAAGKVRGLDGRLPAASRFAGRAFPVFAVGHSRGGFAAYISGIEATGFFDGIVAWNGHFVDLEAVYTRSAVAEMRETGSGRYGGKKNGMLLDAELLCDLDRNAERYDVYRRAGEAGIPMLFVQGEEDFAFIRRASAKLAKLNALFEHIVIRGANHTFGASHPFKGTNEGLERALSVTVDFMSAVANTNMKEQSQ